MRHIDAYDLLPEDLSFFFSRLAAFFSLGVNKGCFFSLFLGDFSLLISFLPLVNIGLNKKFSVKNNILITKKTQL